MASRKAREGQSVGVYTGTGGAAGHVFLQGDATGNLVIVGPAAEDAAASGNPLLSGGRYDATPRDLDDGDVGAIALDADANQIVVGPSAENAAVIGSPVLGGGRYDSSARTLGNGDVGAVALDVTGRQMVAGGVAHDAASTTVNPVVAAYEAADFDGAALPNAVDTEGDVARAKGTLSGIGLQMLVNEDGSASPIVAEGTAAGVGLQIVLDDGTDGVFAQGDTTGRAMVVGPAAHDAAAAGNPLLMGAEANAADRADVDEDDVAQFSADLAGYVRARLKGYDAAADASKVAPTVTDADRYLDSEELVDGTSIDADPALYYPSTAGLEMGEFDHLTVQFVLANGSVVTIEATLDDDGTPDWIDITPSGYLLNADSTGNASFTDVSGIVDFDGLNVQKVRVKLDGDGDSDAQIHIKRRRR